MLNLLEKKFSLSYYFLLTTKFYQIVFYVDKFVFIK